MGLSLFRAFLVINVFSIGTENPITPKPYRFSVYPVNKCPGSKTEFQRASQRKNCTKDLRYLCTPNKYLSSLIEFCTDRKRSLYGEGNCVVLEGTGDLDHYRCVEKFNRSCPSTPYYDEEIYKYPACLEIDKELRCFIAENGCNQREFLTTETHLNISKMETFGNETFRGDSHGLLAIGYIIAIAIVLTVIILIWIIFQKRKKEQVEKSKDNSENESLLNDNPEIDDDKLRQFLSKGEITVCHVRCIIVGCAKAGKTTLLKRLQNVSYDELMKIERTEIVDFHVNSFEVLLEEETIQSIEKADPVPTILFSKENLERPLKENDGKMAEEAHQPSIEKADTVPTFLFSKENLEMPPKEKDGKMAEEAHQPSIRKKIVSEKSSLKNATQIQIPMDILNNQANNHNAEDEENLICKPHSQDTTLVQNQIFPEPNEQHGEDIDAIVDQNDFEQSAISKIKDAVNELLNEKDLRPRITFLDFAGQSMYYAFHQIFLRPKSCSILVVDLTKVLGDKVGVQLENEKECSQFASWSYRDYYKFWLRSIDVFSDTESPVIIVGTHADGLTEEGRREFPESLLKFFDECCHSDHKRHINADRMYAIGFPDSGSELEDLKKIKKCIANIVRSPRYSKENIRPVWALFEHILNIMKENRKVISRKTLSDYIDQLIAQEFRINESEISKMLDFFHRVGVLLYFDKDGLKENIILDIQWLLDAFKCIIDYPVNPEKPDIKRRLFYQTGELDNVELDRIWNKEGKGFLKHKTTIIAYMQQLGLLMPLKELHPIDSNVYYCPSMNSKRFDKTGEHNSKSSILCFKFDEEMQLQINVFYGIVLKCSKLNNWSISTYRQGNKNNICLYQNTACFSFREHNVVLCNCNFEIRVQVWALPEIYDGRLLKKIKHSVEDIIHDVGLSYEIGYKCRKDVLNDEKDVSFISHSIFPVSNYVKCETCEIDKNHVVKNDICWELEVNDENEDSRVNERNGIDDQGTTLLPQEVGTNPPAETQVDGSIQEPETPNGDSLNQGMSTSNTQEEIISSNPETPLSDTSPRPFTPATPNEDSLIQASDTPNEAGPQPSTSASQITGGEITRSDQDPSSSPFLVVAIDFGTTFSGYAFQFRHDYVSDGIRSIYANTSWVADGGNGLMSWKTPTTLLINTDDSFNSFGYEAEDVYQELIENDEHHDYHYFRRFKMMLHDKMIMDRNVTIEDSGGRKYPALSVFQHSISYLKDHFFKIIEDRALGLEPEDITWVLTVPAIWNEPAKQFMREAAVEAGIPSKYLQLALEPEAASLFCKYIPTEKQTNEDGQNIKLFPFCAGTRYMILDLGGGTGDFTVHEVIDENTLKELNVASGGAWGGTNVDRAYMELLISIFGEDVIKRFKTERRTDMLEFQRDFEMKKRTIRDRMGQNIRPVVISIPACLSEYVREMKGWSLENAISNSEYADKIKLKPGNKFAFARELMETLFQTTKEQIVQHVREILENQDSENRISAILMVGGFSTSNIIVDAIKEAFPDLRVVVPPEPGLAVVKGAVLYGHAPLTIASRVCKYTYGVAVYDTFKEGIHPPEKRLETKTEVLCKDVFNKFIEAGQSVSVNSSVDKTYDVTEPNAPMALNIFATTEKNPAFTTDEKCEMLGSTTIQPPEGGWKKDAKIKVSMKFGGTEFEVHATDEQSPQTVYSTQFDFLTFNSRTQSTLV